MPSITSNSRYDYLPPPLTSSAIARFPSDEAWPTNPPRGDIYCETSMMTHPLVSPLAASDWHGACPVWIGVGEEMLSDEGAAVAANMAKQGVKVRWEMFEAMPHCFPLVLETCGLEATRRFSDDWAGFCRDVIRGKVIETKGTFFEAKTCKEIEVNVEELSILSQAEILWRMRACQEARREGTEGEAKVMPRL